MMTVVKCGSEEWALQEMEEDLLVVSQRNCLRFVLGTRLTNRILNRKLHEKFDSIPLSRALMRERLGWLGNVLRKKNSRLSLSANRTIESPQIGWKGS